MAPMVALLTSSFWVIIEATVILLAAAVVVYLLFAVGARSRGKTYEPAALKMARELNPKWDEDMDVCNEMMRKGSKSFFTASKLLPGWMRPPTLALYAYCRHGDDVIDGDETFEDIAASKADERAAKVATLRRLHARLNTAFDETIPVGSLKTPVERTFAAVVRAFEVPKEMPLALLEGFEWDMYDDIEDTCRYKTIDDTIAYSVRVASAVGGMMVALMPHDLRRPEVMARAFDLGIGMQLTNISRDVGEDARNGRCYLPSQWLQEEGVDRAALLSDPKMTPALARVVKRLLDTADVYYQRADAGIKFLPADVQLAVQGAGCIYGDIGRVVRLNGYDSVNTRAVTSKLRKLFMLAVSYAKMLIAPYVRCAEPAAKPAQYLVDEVCSKSKPASSSESALSQSAESAESDGDSDGSDASDLSDGQKPCTVDTQAFSPANSPVKRRKGDASGFMQTVRKFPAPLLYTPVAACKPHIL